jgi:hypothetical protein
MNTLTKIALGLIGQLNPERAAGYAPSTMPLSPAQVDQPWPLMQTL